MSESKEPPKRVFTEEFKRDAVRLAVERGNVCATARDLGIHETILGRWKRAVEKEAPAPSAPPVSSVLSARSDDRPLASALLGVAPRALVVERDVPLAGVALVQRERAGRERLVDGERRAHRVVTQVTATDWPSFIQKSGLRADSVPARLSDKDFEQGMAALRNHGDAIYQNDAVTEEIDWFVFTRHG